MWRLIFAHTGYPSSTPAGWTPSPSFRFPRIGVRGVRSGGDRTPRSDRAPVHLGRSRSPPERRAMSTPSIERIQVRTIGADRQRHVITCNGQPIPMLATDNPDVMVGGVRYLGPGSRPARCTPASPSTTPLRFELVDLATEPPRGGMHVPRRPPRRSRLRHPAGQRRGGRVRRGSRFEAHGFTPGRPSSPMFVRKWHGCPPTSAHLAFSICAGSGPCCRAEAGGGEVSLTVTGADLGSHDPDGPWRATGRPRPGDPVRRPRQRPGRRGVRRHRLRRVRQRRRRGAPGLARTRRPGGDRGRRAWTASATCCAGWSTTTASPTSRSIGTARRSPTATGWRCPACGTSTASHWWSRPRTGRP